MIIGTIKEKKKFENRVAISPDEVKNYVKAGHQVLIEKNAGLLSGFTDKSYTEAGASITSAKETLSSSDIVVKINCPSSDEAKQLKSSSMVISQLNTQNDPIGRMVTAQDMYQLTMRLWRKLNSSSGSRA